MISRTAAEIAAATGGRVLTGPEGRRATAVCIDSRTVRPGDLFFAIEGPRHDGHRFLAEAAAAGATVAVVSRAVETPPSMTLVQCADTTEALGRLAADERRRRELKVVAITGSAGKTTTRRLAAAALAATTPTGSSPGNLNNQWGLPLSLLGLDAKVRVAVLEIGINHPGDMPPLAHIAAPDVAVITNVLPAHIGHFGSLAAIAREKLELLSALGDGGVAVLPAEQPLLLEPARNRGHRVLGFGLSAEAELRAEKVRTRPLRGVAFVVDGVNVELALWGRHAVHNALAALAAARALGAPLDVAAAALGTVEAGAGRGRVLELPGGTRIVDESYNANPASTVAMLEEAAQAPRQGRLVAVLGDMLELGELSEEAHRTVGRAARDVGVDLLVTVGEMAETMADAARPPGPARIEQCADAAEAAARLSAALEDGDLVLIKGSRGVGLERVVEALQALPGRTRS
ncbi:MAG: UDP-N-acetylmuramoyl-tripeptide--D-alanyl-D-alanine ligase [Acidobacteriota bacterium]|nr:UDP-N-acetylmuramoyl-tripeptide--D-alanyl-D-alanine ligase [Acidobacteriota bacterium]MDQ7087926.1 UDP-N-acetylmuramoyl-tripeptide--D-alanyl-D-alanine ligase [Acidobacteriota bacterium]